MNFSWVAEDYFQNSQFQYEHAQIALSRHSFRGDEAVLDVGCGDGKITAEIARKTPGGFVVGIDSSEPMIKFAASAFAHKNKNLNFKVCRAEEISEENKFDLVVSFACLHWVKDQLAFLLGAKKALKTGGKIIITLYPKHPYIWDSIQETVEDVLWKDYFKNYENPHVSYNIKIYENFCNKAGLRINHIIEHVPVAYFKTFKEMKDFLRSWLPHSDQVHPHLRDEFINTIGERFLKKAPKKNGIIGMPFRRLDAVLLKE